MSKRALTWLFAAAVAIAAIAGGGPWPPMH